MTAVPTAEVHAERRWSRTWIIPILALALAGWLGYTAWQDRGVQITIQVDEAHGLAIGDPIRYLGTTVGRVESIDVSDDLGRLLIRVRMDREAAGLARGGSRFWIVRPQFGLDGVVGLDTIVGPRYIAVVPGNGGRRNFFIGLANRPVVENIAAGDLEVVLQADRRLGLSRGAAVSYRGVRIGSVLSVGLSSDAGAVEARVHIERAYTSLLRPETRFWSVSGIDTEFGLTGLSLQIDSLQTMLIGGVEIATPPPTGSEVVRTGHRFVLHAEPEDAWLDWQPLVALGRSQLPAGVRVPRPLRATIGWTEGRLFKGTESLHGWILQTEDGVLGPANLLQPDEDASKATAVLEAGGRTVVLNDAVAWEREGLGRRDIDLNADIWPMSLIRYPSVPEDCLAITDLSEDPLPLAAGRLAPRGSAAWTIDEAVPISPSLHGACVVARRDGALLGMIVLDDDDRATVVLIADAGQAGDGGDGS